MVLWGDAQMLLTVASILVCGCVFGAEADVGSDSLTSKWKEYYKNTDANKDGVLTMKDIELLAANMIKMATYRTDTDQLYADVVSAVSSITELDHDDEKTVTEDDFIQSLWDRIDDAQFKTDLSYLAELLFSILNSDNEPDNLSADELGHYYQYRKIDPSVLPDAFEAIDTDNDGKISLEEFVTAALDFFFGEDKNGPGTYLLGRPGAR